ncbi:hypothetical protein TNCV_1973651 [Trichonephila clavipes]|nr:hypothetical protein TNCV_1973651 [Trichonephila clavipes]
MDPSSLKLRMFNCKPIGTINRSLGTNLVSRPSGIVVSDADGCAVGPGKSTASMSYDYAACKRSMSACLAWVFSAKLNHGTISHRRRPSGIVVSGADCDAVGIGFESR